jgi:resuscitation-promoting factor RpfB
MSDNPTPPITPPGVPAPLPPAGWYPDPEFPGRQRWWTGIGWAAPSDPYAPSAPRPKNSSATAGLVLGIIGMFLGFWGVIPLVALIFGILGLQSSSRIIDAAGLPVGRRRAVWAIVLGAIGIGYGILEIAVPGARPHF